ncbi:cytochrome P450 [Streptomyces sp. 8N706]|uniref:cytochrome P450 n=1 Tax=Streptomyces sp. 8N706 TaxID=3457416 RepID=UPI003FD0894D
MNTATRAAPPRRPGPGERLRSWSRELLGQVWPPLPLRSPFRGVLAHHRGTDPLTGHGKSFHAATVTRGEQASSYFRDSGITARAEENGGLCTFRMGRRVAIYQITNTPLMDDDALAPSTDTNRELFGDFMGSLANDDPARPSKRAAVERTLGNGRFIDGLDPEIRRHAARYLERVSGRELALDEFALCWVAHVDSLVPGVLDLTQRPLDAYLGSPQYGRVLRGFFDIASDVISKVNRDAMKEFDLIVPFVRDLLLDNADALAAASGSNMIRRYFALWEMPFTRAAIEELGPDRLKELGTLIVATYDTTALSLLWTLSYLETSPRHKELITAEAHRAARGERREAAEGPSVIDLAVLEALRLGGSNPTALWRRTTRPFVLRHRGRSVTVPPGTMMWLDRRRANRDSAVFPSPRAFDPDNMRAIYRSDRESVSSLLSRSRYEINSFSMINSERNPRKCPGRLFSVRVQALLLSELYARYDVTTHGIDLRLRHHSSMPRPTHPGTLVISPASAPLHTPSEGDR